MLHRYLALALLICLTALGAQASELQWTFNCPLGEVDSSPAVVDMDSDGKSELVLTTTAGSVMLVDAKGQRAWMRGVQIPISISPTVVDLVEDATPEVLAVNQSGRIFCMAGKTGDPIWQYDLPGEIEWGTSAISAADLQGDGDVEVIAGDDRGHVVCLSKEGELLWQYDGPHGQTFCPAVGVVGSGSELSIIISGSKLPVLCLDPTGKERWRIDKSVQGASPVIADIDGDGENEIVTGQGNAVIALDGAGKVLWTHPMPKVIDGSIAVADADEDGEVEIYAIDLSGKLVALAPGGTELWSANVQQRVRRSPAIADVDGDGNIEVVVSGYSGEMYVFTGKGEQKEVFTVTHTTNAAPTLADFDGDGTPYIVYASGAGSLDVYRWPGAKPQAKVLWPEYRFSSARKGACEAGVLRSPVRIGAIDFGERYAGANAFSVSIENPEPKALRTEVTISHSGKKDRTWTHTSSEAGIVFGFNYTISSQAPVTLAVACRIYDGDQLVAQRVSESYIVPFRKEVADLTELLGVVETDAKRLPQAHRIQGEIAEAREGLEAYRERAKIFGTLSDVERRELRDALRGDLKHFARLGALVNTAAGYSEAGQWPLVLSGANPWAPFGGFEEALEGRIGEPAMHLEAFHGEVEAAVLNAFNWSFGGLKARVEIDPLLREGDDAKNAVQPHEVITLHEVVDVPAQTLDLSADALPRMNQASVVTLPPWDARQVWLSVDTSGLTPGTWRTVVHVRTLEVESQDFTAPLTLTVWDAALPEARTLRHCNWGYVSRSRLQYHEEESLAERVAHGNNVFVTSFVPKAKYNEAGEIVGEIDYTAHDDFVRRYAPHGLILFHNTGGISGPGGREGEAYHKAFVAWMQAWVAHLKDMGIGYEGYAMYPVDEPGLRDGLVDLYLFYAKLAREADPKILMYTDPVSRITEEELVEMLPYVDIWCPNRSGFLLDTGAEKLEIMKNSGNTMWTYECAGNVKHQSPLGYYRGQSWLVWHHGFTGIGFWSYCTSGADPWYRPQDTNDYLLTYQGDGVVPSKRWEAVRDGMEDHDMLVALRTAAAKAKEEGRAAEAVAEAEKLLTVRASRIGAFCGIDDGGTEPGKEGLPGVRRLADRRYAAILEVRRDIARLLAILKP